jgi:transposase-like protein
MTLLRDAVAIGRPSKLTPEVVELAREAASAGGAWTTIAAACNVQEETVRLWVREAKAGREDGLYQAFLTAINEGRHQAELKALRKITAFDDSRDAQWWLTHHPSTRDTWSDAAATRREVDRVLSMVAKGVSESGLPPDQQRAVLLSIRANGAGVNDAADD